MHKSISVIDVKRGGHKRDASDPNHEDVERIAAKVKERDSSARRGVSVLCTGGGARARAMAVAVADSVDQPLYRVDLGAVVSQYIGETEKNLEAVFAEAARADAVLLFDEADALLGKRSDVADAHDRYANAETDALLQRIEDYEGLAILATNSKQNVDAAFLRRFRFTID